MATPSSKASRKLEAVDLHDALLKTINLDYQKSRCVIEIDYYLNTTARVRVPGRITFDSIETIAFLANISELKRHDFAGHISYWRRNADSRETHIYLAAGSVMVRAKKVALVRERKTVRSKKSRSKNV